MHWTFIIGIIYLLIVIVVCLRIVYETRSTTKTMAYLLFTIFIPIVGIIFYILFGINYWKRKLYDKKSVEDEKMLEKLKKEMAIFVDETLQPTDIAVENNKELATMLVQELRSPLTRRNKVKLLINGEVKFPEVLQQLPEKLARLFSPVL